MKKKRIAYLVVLFLLVTNIAGAAYIVHDPKIFVQVKEQLTTVRNIVQKTQQQIDNQLKDLMAFNSNILKPFTKGFQDTTQAINDTKNEFKGIMNPVHTATEAWESTFKSLENVSQEELTFTHVFAAKKQMDNAKEVNHKDTLFMIQNIRNQQAEQQKRIAALLELNRSPEGQKQALQIANQLEAEKILAQNLENELNMLLINQETMDKQIEKTNQDNLQKHNEKVAAGFQEWKNIKINKGDTLFPELKKR